MTCLCSCGLFRRWKMQPGSVFFQFGQPPFKSLPDVTAPSPFSSMATKLQTGQHREKLRPFHRPPPLPSRNRLPNKASSPFLYFSVLSGHTLLVGCLVRLLFLRSVGIFPWCPHFILFRHLYRISDKECQKKQATPPSNGVFPDVAWLCGRILL
jgi:hypothetical protein